MLHRDRLRLARVQLGLSQGALGGAIGQDQSYVSKLERGELQGITIHTLGRPDSTGFSGKNLRH